MVNTLKQNREVFFSKYIISYFWNTTAIFLFLSLFISHFNYKKFTLIAVLSSLLLAKVYRKEIQAKYINTESVVIYGLLTFCLGRLFYAEWISSYSIQQIASKFFISSKVIVISFLMGVFIFSVPIFAALIGTVLNWIRKTNLSKYYRSFLIITGMYLIGLIPILRANVKYIDDIGRVAYGYKNWGRASFSRFLSDFLSTFIHTGEYLVDVSPLTQFIAILLLSFSSVIILVTFVEKKRYSIIDCIALLPLGLSPYFLECLSYKYDSPYMALSILFAVLPIVFVKNKQVYFLSIVLCTLGMCTTYQASSGIFPMLVIAYFLKQWYNGKNSIKSGLLFLFESALAFLFGIILFKTCFMIEVDTYVSNTITGLENLLPAIKNNYSRYFDILNSDLRHIWKLVISAISLLLVFNLLLSTKQYSKVFTLLITLTSVVLMILLMFGLYPFLSKPLFVPRAMYGFGAYLALINVLLLGSSNENNCFLEKMLIFMLGWLFIAFSFCYGNALYEQKQYTFFRQNEVAQSLSQYKYEGKNAVIGGSIGHAPAIENMPEDYKLIRKLVPITFNTGWVWGFYDIACNYKTKISWQYSEQVDYSESVLVEETSYHRIYESADFIIVELI